MRAAFLLFLAAIGSAHAAGTRPLVPLYDAPALTKACDAGLEAAQARIGAMEATRGAGAIFDEWNRLSMQIEDLQGPVYLLGSVHPDKAVRDAAEPCLQRLNTLGTDVFQSEKLYARVKAAVPRTAHQKKLKKDLIEGFEDTGAVLPPQRRARAKRIFERLETLRQAFERNIRDDPTTVTFTAAEMEGLSAAYLEAHKADAQGNYVLRLDYPSYVPFMENARSGRLGEGYYLEKYPEDGKYNQAPAVGV
jgi:thimet oligopeptidase